jgi:hypothetical protein
VTVLLIGFFFNFVAVTPEETSKEELEKLMLGFLTDITFLEEKGTLAECTTHRVCNLNKYAATAPEPHSMLIPLLRYKQRRFRTSGFSSLVAYSAVSYNNTVRLWAFVLLLIHQCINNLQYKLVTKEITSSIF